MSVVTFKWHDIYLSLYTVHLGSGLKTSLTIITIIIIVNLN